MQTTPPGRVGRIHRDHPQPLVGSHPDQQVAERPGGDPRDQAAEPLATPATAKPLTTAVASISEIQVLHHDRPAPGGLSGVNGLGDGGPEPSVTGGGGQPCELQGDGGGVASGVAAWVQHPASQRLGVQVQGKAGMLL